jgi:hypothetical protein
LASPIYRRVSAKIESELSSLLSSLDKFNAAVLGAAGFSGIVGNGFVRALTNSTHVERIAP